MKAKQTKQPTQPPATEALAHISEPLRPLAVLIKTLTPDDRNVRAHPERNLQAIVASLTRFGQQAPVVFVTQGRRRVVVKGNGLLAAAKRLGWKHLAAVASTLAGDDAKAFAIADNRTTDLSEFDEALLAAQLQELEEAEYDIAAAGFTDEELQALVEAVDEPPGRPVDSSAGEAAERKRGARMMGFTLGQFHFEVERQAYDAWLTALEAKTGADADAVVKELRRRLKL